MVPESRYTVSPSAMRAAAARAIAFFSAPRSELPNTKDARNFMRFFLSGATVCEFDKQGRINISAPLIKYAELNKDCIIIGVNDRLEVWSKDRWENFIDTNEDSLSDIADKLFSSNLNI